MAPLSETEIMTLKRLEVAIRKMDFKLLKSGAYKLHEKFHSGHTFEYTDLLKEIYSSISTNMSIPKDIKDILIPTIEDILEAQSIPQDETQKEAEPVQNRVSSLTSLSYNTKVMDDEKPATTTSTLTSTIDEVPVEDKKISAYDAFGTSRAGISSPDLKSNTFESISENISLDSSLENQMLSDTLGVQMETIKPIQDEIEASISSVSSLVQEQKSKPEAEAQTQQSINFNQNLNPNSFEIKSFSELSSPLSTADEKPKEINQEQPAPIQDEIRTQMNKIPEPAVELEPEKEETEQEAVEREVKSVAIFFSQDSSREKIKNITMYRELISKLKSEHISLDETLKLISEIKLQSDTNVMELRNILSQFKFLDNRINLITNSSSSNLVSLLTEMEFPFAFIEQEEDKKLTLNPMFGLSNLFTCSNCDEKYLDDSSKVEPLVLTCPKCKSPMYPTFYAVDGVNVEMNTNYYNYALKTLANSRVWLIVHPGLNDIFTINMFKTALNVSSKVDEIYILDKDINVRETYKSALLDAIPEGRKIFIDTQINALEIFFKSVKE